jgi:hypothetical protein
MMNLNKKISKKITDVFFVKMFDIFENNRITKTALKRGFCKYYVLFNLVDQHFECIGRVHIDPVVEDILVVFVF